MINGSAGKIIVGNITDIVVIGNGKTVAADKIKTDAKIAFSREISGNLNYFFIKNGTEFYYNNSKIFNSSKPVTIALKFLPDGAEGYISGCNESSSECQCQIQIKTDIEPDTIILNNFNNNCLQVYGSGSNAININNVSNEEKISNINDNSPGIKMFILILLLFAFLIILVLWKVKTR